MLIFIKNNNIYLLVSMSDHNSWTPSPICFKYWLVYSLQARKCSWLDFKNC